MGFSPEAISDPHGWSVGDLFADDGEGIVVFQLPNAGPVDQDERDHRKIPRWRLMYELQARMMIGEDPFYDTSRGMPTIAAHEIQRRRYPQMGGRVPNGSLR